MQLIEHTFAPLRLLLAYSGAKPPSDRISVVWPLAEVTAPGEILLEVAGFRYQGIRFNELKIDMPVAFVPEPDNETDSKALRMEAGGRSIGYVKRAQRDVVTSWLARYDVDARIDRISGTAERALVYVFCRLSECPASPPPSRRLWAEHCVAF
ncbi:hypothetical protein HAP94_10710 [Acidithiobacillus ferrivorans]|nr:hypothetical protein [Acidithiobacillus ferrivorans]